MNKIKSLIDKSPTWNFDRRILINNKLYGSINQGTVSWNLVDKNIFNCIEEGNIEFKSGEKGVFNSTLKFVFKGNDYQVYKSNNILFYTSNKNNRYSSKDNHTLIELNIVNNIITFRYELHTKKEFRLQITNYYY